MLEQIGRSRFRDLLGFEDESEKVKTTAMIEEIVKAHGLVQDLYRGSHRYRGENQDWRYNKNRRAIGSQCNIRASC